MTEPVHAFTAGLAALVGHAALVALALKLRFPKSPMAAHVWSGALWVAALSGLSLLQGGGPDMWRSLALFAFGWALLLFAYSAVYKSISLRVLRQTAQGGSALSFAELAERSLRKSFDGRVALLTGQGLVEYGNGGYRLTPAGKRTAAVIAMLRRLFSAETGGMYGLGKEGS